MKESCSESARIVAANQIKEQLELTFDPEAKNVEDIIKVILIWKELSSFLYKILECLLYM